MSLIGALNAAKSALAVQQAAIQVTSNNISNAGNADYTRQVANVSTAQDQQVGPGIFVGSGINLDSVQRQIDEALQGRLRGSIADLAQASTETDWLSRVEAAFNELSDEDLSTRFSDFFNSWSNLANQPSDVALRQVVVQAGDSLASSINSLRTTMGNLQSASEDQLNARAADADQLASKIATLNAQIVAAEGGSRGEASGLRDQRDAMLSGLAKLMDVKGVLQSDGTMTVYVGSEPLVVAGTSMGVGVKTDSVNGELVSKVIFKGNNGTMKVSGGQLGALLDVRNTQIGGVIDSLDTLASGVIYELNKIYSSGQGLTPMTSVTGNYAAADVTAALNSKAADLDFTPTNGSFVVSVKDSQTGLSTSTLVPVDLDGIGSDTSLTDLKNALNAVPGISATISAGKLSIQTASANQTFSFSQDTSGVLAALGVNTFFTGSNARSIAVNQTIKDDPSKLAAAANGDSTDNQTALAIAAMESQSFTSLKHSSIQEFYQSIVNGVSVKASAAKSDAAAAQTVNDTLFAQREALSGVSLDEEAINLMKQQRAYQGAARVISAIDELMKTLLSIT